MVQRIAVLAAVLAALAFAAPAGAAVTASSVTAPANGSAWDANLDSPGQVTISGTATADTPATDKVNLVCTYANAASGSASLATNPPAGVNNVSLTPTGIHTGTFSVTVPDTGWEYYTCLLRAVPTGPSPSDFSPYTGPVIQVSGHATYNTGGQLYDFEQDISGPLAYWAGYSTSSCFVDTTFSMDPTTLDYPPFGLFGCAAVFGVNPDATASSLRVDGHDAFLPYEAHSVHPAITGFEPITAFTRHVDPPSGDTQMSWTEPIVRCADGSAAYPPTCPAWTDAGLSDRAITIGDHGGRLVRHTDTWTNSGAAASQLDVWYQIAANGSALAWKFPGETAYAAHVTGDHSGAGGTIPTPPTGPASLLVAADPAQVDFVNPRGSLTWSSPPSEIRFTDAGTVYLRYQRTIPAGGAVATTFTFATDGSQASVDALTATARAAMLPTVAIGAPADGATVSGTPVTITGTAADDGPVTVSVNGHAATMGAAGTWSASVPLQQGANAIVATATDGDGNVAQAQRTVSLVFPKGHPPVPVPNAFTFKVTKPKAGAKTVTITLTLPGPGTVAGSLTSSLTRAARTTTLAKASKTAKAAGKLTLKLRLSKKALSLIRKHHTVKGRLTLKFSPTGGTPLSKTTKVTLRAKKKH
jgi:hypothetical protein